MYNKVDGDKKVTHNNKDQTLMCNPGERVRAEKVPCRTSCTVHCLRLASGFPLPVNAIMMSEPRSDAAYLV